MKAFVRSVERDAFFVVTAVIAGFVAWFVMHSGVVTFVPATATAAGPAVAASAPGGRSLAPIAVRLPAPLPPATIIFPNAPAGSTPLLAMPLPSASTARPVAVRAPSPARPSRAAKANDAAPATAKAPSGGHATEESEQAKRDLAAVMHELAATL